MKPKSPLMKKLVGGQKNLPEHLKNAIEASPMKYKKSPAKYEKDPKEMAARKKKEAKQKQGPKEKGIVYKNGKKYYKASDGTLHTGQVSDYEQELKADKERYYSKKGGPKYENADEVD
jgi:glucan-binding YG repeat protein